MSRVIALVFIILMASGCTTTKTVIEYREIIKKPPEVILTECIKPFNTRPITYGEAAERDEVWSSAFDLCAKKIDENRRFYGYD